MGHLWHAHRVTLGNIDNPDILKILLFEEFYVVIKLEVCNKRDISSIFKDRLFSNKLWNWGHSKLLHNRSM